MARKVFECIEWELQVPVQVWVWVWVICCLFFMAVRCIQWFYGRIFRTIESSAQSLLSLLMCGGIGLVSVAQFMFVEDCL